MSKVKIKSIELHFRILKVLYWLGENNDFAEFKVLLIHMKLVHLLHNTILILCNEGAGLVAVFPVLLIHHFAHFSVSLHTW